MLTDASALVAFLYKDDRAHTVCAETVRRLASPMLTTWLTFGEAYYLLGRIVGYTAQDVLYQLVEDGILELHDHTPADLIRMRTLTRQHKDIGRGGMDLGDASLVVVAETRGLRTVFTLDSHFYAYQLADGSYLNVVPSARGL